MLLPVGTYYLFVAPNDYFNFNCPEGFDYLASVKVTEVESGYISAEVISSFTVSGIEGVKVTAGDYYSKTTNAAGLCLIEVPVGTYSVTADGYEQIT